MPETRRTPPQGAPEEPAHDVLAAEEFGMPARDPRLRRGHEPAHDVLAAEEFGMPARDPRLGRARVDLPSDPTGIAEPHDVLAAEEFAMPAPRGGVEPSEAAAPRASLLPRAIGAALALIVVRRVLRRR